MISRSIQLSKRGESIYQLLYLSQLLLLLYALGFTLRATCQLPSSPLSALLDLAALQGFTAYTLKLLLLTGLLSAGIMMAGGSLEGSAVQRWRRFWSGLVAFIIVISPFAPSTLLDNALTVFLLLTLAWIGLSQAHSTYLRVWQLGMLLVLITQSAEYLTEGAIADIVRASQTQVGFALCGLSTMFWLMTRFSRVENDWTRDGVRIVALLVFLGGSVISLGAAGLPVAISLSAAPLVLLCYSILASHSYRGLRSRNENASLAPHWIALATLLWLVGAGFLGALSIQPAVAEAMRATNLAAAQTWLTHWVILAVILAFVNEAAASLLGGNRRVTGYVPFWLIAFGVCLSGITQVCRGVVEIYLRDVSGLEGQAAADLLLPLTIIWITCLLSVTTGIVTYALGFWLRRPQIHVIAD